MDVQHGNGDFMRVLGDALRPAPETMTLADELHDVLQRDDSRALRELFRANAATIIRAVRLDAAISAAIATANRRPPLSSEYYGKPRA